MENVDIKTIIYFLIAIVWFIFSVFRKSQKKAERPAPTSSETGDEEGQVDVKTLLEEILSGKTAKEKEKDVFSKETPAPVYEKKEKKTPITKPFYSGTSIKPQSVSTPKVTPTTSSTQAERIFEMEEEIQHEILSDFDLRKAIIYSEILKRPQY